METKFVDPFSPTIMETTVSEQFLDIVNSVGDDVLSSDTKSIQYDWSHKLVGKVSKEVQIPIPKGKDREHVLSTMRKGCVDYLNHIIDKNRAYNWYKIAGRDKRPTVGNINIVDSWIVSQYSGEYNPAHHHTGDFSSVIYLKIPPKMQSELDVEIKDHYPANGLIEFLYGENCDMRSDTMKYIPKEGMMLVFLSYLKHFVYPFYSEGERRSMSFNARMSV